MIALSIIFDLNDGNAFKYENVIDELNTIPDLIPIIVYQ